MNEDEVFISLTEAGKYARVGRQAIFQAIKKKQLKAVKKMLRKNQAQWIISRKDLDEYRSQKYNCEKREFQGEKLIDLEQNRWSVAQAAKVLSVMLCRSYPSAHLYYLLRIGELRAQKRGGMWVISKEELTKIYQKEMGGDIQGYSNH